MALDPSIALGYRPPQVNVEVPHPLEQFGQILTLRDLMQRGQMNQYDLQTKLLNLQQLQRTMQEQQDYAAAMKAYAEAAGSTTASAAPVQTAPVVPPVQPTPLGGTAAQTAPAAVIPQTAIPSMVAPPTPAPQGAATIAPNFGLAPAPTAAAAPATASSVMGNPGMSRLGGMNAAQFIARFPLTGLSRIKEAFALDQAQNEALIKDYDAKAKAADGLAGIARKVEAATDKPAAFADGVYEAGRKGYMSQEEQRMALAHGYSHDFMQGFIEQSDKFKEYHEAQKADLESLGTAQKNAAEWLRGVNDQATYDQGFSQLDPRVQKILGATYSPALKTLTANWGVPGAEAPKLQMSTREAAAPVLAAAIQRGPAAFNAELHSGKYDPDTVSLFMGSPDARTVMMRAQSPDKYIEEQRLNRAQLLEGERVRLDRGKFELDKQKFDAEYGAGTAESAVEQIYANPDSVREVLSKIPAGMYPRVQALMQSKHGMPLPVPLEGTAKQQESAGNRTLADITWIRGALQNPNIAKNIGPILGRLQNVEQATGEATGLTGADAAMAQEFRTRMRNMLADEAGALYRRVNPKVLDDLAKSSGNITMGSDMLSGALNGVEETVKNNLNSYEQQRWGAGKMRPPEARGLQATAPSAAQQKALSDLPHDGKIHQLSDGSVWQVNTDGRITPAQVPR